MPRCCVNEQRLDANERRKSDEERIDLARLSPIGDTDCGMLHETGRRLCARPAISRSRIFPHSSKIHASCPPRSTRAREDVSRLRQSSQEPTIPRFSPSRFQTRHLDEQESTATRYGIYAANFAKSRSNYEKIGMSPIDDTTLIAVVVIRRHAKFMKCRQSTTQQFCSMSSIDDITRCQLPCLAAGKSHEL